MTNFFKYLPVTVVYRGYSIEMIDGYCGGRPIVHYCGDDVVFSTVKEAEKFIDEILGVEAE